LVEKTYCIKLKIHNRGVTRGTSGCPFEYSEKIEKFKYWMAFNKKVPIKTEDSGII